MKLLSMLSLCFVLLALSACSQDSGTVYVYFENGKIEREILKRDGKIYKVITYLRSGVKNYEIDVRDGKRNGKEVIFNADGAVKSTRYYVDDKLFGFGVTYNEDGSIYRVFEYRNDSLINEWLCD